jgi:nitrilase
MRVAAAQARPVWLDKAATTGKVITTLEAAARDNVDLLAFPETFLSGYPVWVSRTDGARFDDARQKDAYARYLEAAVEIPGPELSIISEAVADLGVFTYLGTTERVSGGGTVYCTLVAIDPTHGIVSTHRKLMPTHDERLVWGAGDGHGLRVHEVQNSREPIRAGGLNCWENWMPQARHALYAGGEELHIGVWPGSANLTRDITRFIALEGRMWSVAASGLLSADDVPSTFPFADVLRTGERLPFNGGSCIAGPTGEWVVEPVLDEETLVVADIDLARVREERLTFDSTGHYGRHDVFKTEVNRRRLTAAEFLDD